LLVTHGERHQRVQVKTTTVASEHGWFVWISTTGKVRRAYTADEIDSFFVIDGDLNYYLIPISAVGGYQMIELAAYDAFRVQARPVER
jgi:hypothetical protein